MFNSSLKKEKENLENTIKELNKKIIKLEDEVEALEKKKEEISEENIIASAKANLLVNSNKSIEEMNTELMAKLLEREEFYADTELKYIDSLSGYDFENYCADLLEKLDYKCEVTKASQDGGVDIIAKKNDHVYVIQCKNYSNNVGNSAVQEVYSAQGLHNADKAIVFTNSYYTNQAISEADKLGVELWNRDRLKDMLYIKYKFILSCKIQKPDTDIDEENFDDDLLLEDVIDAVIEYQIVSTSFIQRRFNIGYARAGRIVDQMEKKGIISGPQGSKPRDILMTKEQWEELKK